MDSPGDKINDTKALTVRRMSASDASPAYSILEESPEASTWSRESLQESVSQGVAWAAELDGRVVGILIGRVAAEEFDILNLAVGKKTYFGETRFLEVRADVFNILNHANFARPASGIFSAPTATLVITVSGGTNSQITLTDTAARQIQLALKVIW